MTFFFSAHAFVNQGEGKNLLIAFITVRLKSGRVDDVPTFRFQRRRTKSHELTLKISITLLLYLNRFYLQNFQDRRHFDYWRLFGPGPEAAVAAVAASASPSMKKAANR